jgi:hypothetical protein
MAFKSSDKRKEEIEKLHQQLNQLPNFKPKKPLSSTTLQVIKELA